MSRTDAHRPWRVQQADPHERHRWYRFATYPTQPPQLWPTYVTCGCRLCTGHDARKLARRRERVQWRAERQALLADRGHEIRPIRGRA